MINVFLSYYICFLYLVITSVERKKTFHSSTFYIICEHLVNVPKTIIFNAFYFWKHSVEQYSTTT